MACVAVRCSVLQCVALKLCEDLVTARLEHSVFFFLEISVAGGGCRFPRGSGHN